MDRNQAKKFYPILQAFAEGRVIECRTRTWELNKGWQYSTNWKETEELKFQDTYEYRIKPEPKYRPFANAEECWKEMQKHQPFGWVKDRNGSKYTIENIDYRGCLSINDDGICNFDETFENYTFADGASFGIKEEE